jgi:hypothetical protein
LIAVLIARRVIARESGRFIAEAARVSTAMTSGNFS